MHVMAKEIFEYVVCLVGRSREKTTAVFMRTENWILRLFFRSDSQEAPKKPTSILLQIAIAIIWILLQSNGDRD